jgi:hypothetical protein
MSYLRLGPMWRFRGIQYRTITGLHLALFRDSGGDWMSSVVDGRITVRANDKVVALYSVPTPRPGEEMLVERVPCET